MGAMLLIGGTAGLFPEIRAARLAPIEALTAYLSPRDPLRLPMGDPVEARRLSSQWPVMPSGE